MIDILFKILKGDSSRISMDVTPFHEGYAYVTEDQGGFYVDLVVNGENKRVQINPDEIPAGGIDGQLLTKTASGWEWKDAPKTVSASSKTPLMDGTAALGSDTGYAKGDHVHPTDTSRQAKITAKGILKGTAGGIEAAAAGTDYMAPASNDASAAAGQVLTKTADGQEWADAAGDVFWATYNETSAAEIRTAYDAGKLVVVKIDNNVEYLVRSAGSGSGAVGVFARIEFNAQTNASQVYYRRVILDTWGSARPVFFTPDIHAADHAKDGVDPITPADIGAIASDSLPSTASVLKSDGSGGLAAAEAGTDYIASGNIVKQTLVNQETAPTENYAINWVWS